LDAEVPFAPKKWNVIYTLPQLAYSYDVGQKKKIPVLQEIIDHLEATFPIKISAIWCNKFNDGKHRIDWHQDQYGEHLFVLSFGATRRIDYRDHSSKKPVEGVVARHGDLYYMHPKYDAVHDHCVPADDAVVEPRISLAIFASIKK
jgi:alkylated DNA repair dioxygenase AlkB